METPSLLLTVLLHPPAATTITATIATANEPRPHVLFERVVERVWSAQAQAYATTAGIIASCCCHDALLVRWLQSTRLARVGPTFYIGASGTSMPACFHLVRIRVRVRVRIRIQLARPGSNFCEKAK